MKRRATLSKTPSHKKSIKVVPLGGLGEIGMNMMCIEFGKDAIIVDCGVQFADPSLPGVDVLIPNFEYIRSSKLNVRAVILTHGHEDHIGALPYFLYEKKVPVFGSRFTIELLKHKLGEFALLENTELNEVTDGGRVSIGPFDVEFIRMSHSIADALGLCIRTPMGTIVHTGDFKIDPHPADGRTTDMERFKKIGKEGVLLLMSDSTNVDVPGKSKSESSIRDGIDELMKQSEGWFVLSSFASHIPRIQQVIELSIANKKRVFVVGRTMVQNLGLAKRLGYIEYPEALLIQERELKRLARRNVVILSTGSQGESRSALARMANNEHKQLVLEKGDSVVMSSRMIPGNEKSIYHVINQLYRRGAEVFTSTGSDIHVSGHAYKEDLREMLLALKPRYFIPVHGEYRHLVHHVALAREIGMRDRDAILVENGEPVLITEDGARKLQPIDATKVAVDGVDAVSIESDAIKDRRKLSDAGILMVGLTLDGDAGELTQKPVFKSRGIAPEARMQEILPILRSAVTKAINKKLRNPRVKVSELEEEARLTARRVIQDELDKKPMVLPFVAEF